MVTPLGSSLFTGHPLPNPAPLKDLYFRAISGSFTLPSAPSVTATGSSLHPPLQTPVGAGLTWAPTWAAPSQTQTQTQTQTQALGHPIHWGALSAGCAHPPPPQRLPWGSDGKKSACNVGDLGSISRWERYLGEWNAWRIPWTEEPRRLYSPWGQESDVT